MERRRDEVKKVVLEELKGILNILVFPYAIAEVWANRLTRLYYPGMWVGITAAVFTLLIGIFLLVTHSSFEGTTLKATIIFLSAFWFSIILHHEYVILKKENMEEEQADLNPIVSLEKPEEHEEHEEKPDEADEKSDESEEKPEEPKE